MLRLGDKMSDSREVLVHQPALADDDVVLSSPPEVADVDVTSLPVRTFGEESGAPPTLNTIATEPLVIVSKPIKSAMNSKRTEVNDVPATPPPAVWTTANVVRRTFTRGRSSVHHHHHHHHQIL